MGSPKTKVGEEPASKPDVPALFDKPFYELDGRGNLRFANSAVARLFADTTGGATEAVKGIVKREGRSGLMRQILTDSGGMIRAQILAKALERGLEGDGSIGWLRLATKIIETTIAEERDKNGRSAVIPISAGTAIEITTPIQRLLRDVDAKGKDFSKGKGGAGSG